MGMQSGGPGSGGSSSSSSSSGDSDISNSSNTADDSSDDPSADSSALTPTNSVTCIPCPERIGTEVAEQIFGDSIDCVKEIPLEDSATLVSCRWEVYCLLVVGGKFIWGVELINNNGMFVRYS
jgi:hypothetical protein